MATHQFRHRQIYHKVLIFRSSNQVDRRVNGYSYFLFKCLESSTNRSFFQVEFQLSGIDIHLNSDAANVLTMD